MNLITGPAGKLICYMVLAFAGFWLGLQDITADQVANYRAWDWFMKICGCLTVLATTWRAFTDQTISRDAGAPPPPPEKRP